MIQFLNFKTHLFDLIDNAAFEFLEAFEIPLLVNFLLFLQQTIDNSYDIQLLLILFF